MVVYILLQPTIFVFLRLISKVSLQYHLDNQDLLALYMECYCPHKQVILHSSPKNLFIGCPNPGKLNCPVGKELSNFVSLATRN